MEFQWIPWRILKEVFKEFLMDFLRHFLKDSLGNSPRIPCGSLKELLRKIQIVINTFSSPVNQPTSCQPSNNQLASQCAARTKQPASKQLIASRQPRVSQSATWEYGGFFFYVA